MTVLNAFPTSEVKIGITIIITFLFFWSIRTNTYDCILKNIPHWKCMLKNRIRFKMYKYLIKYHKSGLRDSSTQMTASVQVMVTILGFLQATVRCLQKWHIVLHSCIKCCTISFTVTFKAIILYPIMNQSVIISFSFSNMYPYTRSHYHHIWSLQMHALFVTWDAIMALIDRYLRQWATYLWCVCMFMVTRTDFSWQIIDDVYSTRP